MTLSAEHAAPYYDSLLRMGLIEPGDRPPLTPLTGGVSSDILRVDLGHRSLCLKRALPQLRVAATWKAPVERNRFEVEWLKVAGSMVAGSVPAVLGTDPESGTFAMEFLSPHRYPVWKHQLRDGSIDPETAAQVARLLREIHSGSAGNEDISKRFRTDHIFHPIRLEPYLLATATAHPDCARNLRLLAEETLAHKRTLVHGDVSPKNILVGRDGPVLLDAECAWYGDPAFDVAFCLNHLILKCVWRPAWQSRYLLCFERFIQHYFRGVQWEPVPDLERRVAHLLPGLLLGRIDGKSPVEYITREETRRRVRHLARRLLLDPVDRLQDLGNAVAAAWDTGDQEGGH